MVFNGTSSRPIQWTFSSYARFLHFRFNCHLIQLDPPKELGNILRTEKSSVALTSSLSGSQWVLLFKITKKFSNRIPMWELPVLMLPLHPVGMRSSAFGWLHEVQKTLVDLRGFELFHFTDSNALLRPKFQGHFLAKKNWRQIRNLNSGHFFDTIVGISSKASSVKSVPPTASGQQLALRSNITDLPAVCGRSEVTFRKWNFGAKFENFFCVHRAGSSWWTFCESWLSG